MILTMNKIIKNTTLYTIGNILPQAAGFLLLPIYTRFLTPDEYGIIASMSVLGTILVVFFTLCVERSIPRLYFDHENENARRDFLGSITITLTAISLLVLLLIFLFKRFISLIFASIPFYPYYVYLILTVFFSVFAFIPLTYFRINEEAHKFISLSISLFVLNTSLVLWFVCGLNQGAEGWLKGMLFANIIFFPLYIFILYKIINLTFDFSILKESLSFSIPMIPGMLSAWILNLSDRIFIERFFALSDVGIYSLGYTIAGGIAILTSGFLMAYEPMFYKLANSKNQIDAKAMLTKYNTAYLIIVIFIVFLVAFFSKEFVLLLMDPKFADAYTIIPIIALAFLFLQGTGPFNFMIYQSKKTKQAMYIGVSCAILNVMLNFLLVPKYGAYGAAYATLLSFIYLFIFGYWYAATKCYFIPVMWKKLIPYLSVLSIVYLIFQFAVNVDIYLSLISKIGVVVILAIVFLHKNIDTIKKMVGPE